MEAATPRTNSIVFYNIVPNNAITGAKSSPISTGIIMDDIVLDGDIGEGSSLFGGKTYSLSIVIGDILLDGDIVAVSCLCIDIDTGSDESMVADDVVLDEPVSASIFHIDSFFVGVVYVVVGDGEGVCSAETEGFLVHVHTGCVDGVVMDGDVMWIAVSMVDDDAA